MFKLITLCCCMLAFVAADVSELSSEYLPPVQDVQVSHHSASIAHQPSNEYLGPLGGADEVEPAHSFSDDEGYRYRTAKRSRVLRNRNRRVLRNRRVVYRNRRY